MNIAIIGAGFTGLTAAYRLTQKGHTVTIFEKSSDIGGLAGGFSMQNASLEKAYHHLFRTDIDILFLIDELGLSSDLGWYESKVGMLVKEKDSYASYPFVGAGDLLKYSPLPFIDRVRAGVVVFFLQKYTNWKSLVSVTAYSWMEKWSGKKVMDAIWGPLLRGKFSDFATKVSMAWMWARIHIRANSRKSILEKEMLAYPKSGFLSIAEALAAKSAQQQKKNVSETVITNATIESISYKDTKPQLLIQGKVYEFDALLSTIPEKNLEKLVKEPKTDKNETPVDYLSAVVMAFSSSQSLSKYYWHNIIDKDSPFLVFLQHTNLVPTEWYKGQNVYYIGVYIPQQHKYMTKEFTDEMLRKEWFDYVRKLFPSFDETAITQLDLFRLPFAQHVVDLTFQDKIPPYKTLYPNTYMANFAQIFPEDRGTNFAVREGNKIAELIHTDLLQ